MTWMGNRIAPTAPVGDSSNRVADTAFVTAAIATAVGPLEPFPSASGTGSLIYWNGSAWAAFAGNSSGTSFLTESSAGVPSWSSGPTVSGALVSIYTQNAAGTYTVTIPSNATKGRVRLWGGQGGSFTSGVGGGGGGYLEKYLTGLTGGDTLDLTVGAQGTNSASSPSNGGASTLSSGSQSISTLTANGGTAGASTVAGIGATASGGDINIAGINGFFYESQNSGNFSGPTGGGFSGPGGCVIEWYT
jgi:hypothetical protein